MILMTLLSTLVIASPKGEEGVQCDLTQGIYSLCNFTEGHMQLRMLMNKHVKYQITCKFASDNGNQTLAVWTNTQKFKLTDGRPFITRSAPDFGFQNTYLSPADHKPTVLIADLVTTKNPKSSVSCIYKPISS